MKYESLPRTPWDLFKLSPLQWLLYRGLISFFRLSGLWKYSQKLSGDLETMGFLDKVYWLYKTIYPIKKARRNSNLESYFERQRLHRWQIPSGAVPTCELTITAVGDLINHSYLANSQETLYNEVSDIIFGSDIAMANLECPIYPQAHGKFVFNFKTPPPLYYDITAFNIVKGAEKKQYTFMATACNHSLDFGAEGVDSTIKNLEKAGIAYNGINSSEQNAFKATLIDKGNFCLGIIAYTFGLNAFKPPKNRPNIVNHLALNEGVAANDFNQIIQQIKYCKEKNVDFIIAHLHWGLEHEFYPTPEQLEVAHYLCELGVDAIIGHHPHVIQPMEFYRTRRDPSRVIPIYYSLGNLINAFSAYHLTISAVAKLSLIKVILADGSKQVYVNHAEQIQVQQVIDEKNKCIRLVPLNKN